MSSQGSENQEHKTSLVADPQRNGHSQLQTLPTEAAEDTLTSLPAAEHTAMQRSAIPQDAVRLDLWGARGPDESAGLAQMQTSPGAQVRASEQPVLASLAPWQRRYPSYTRPKLDLKNSMVRLKLRTVPG